MKRKEWLKNNPLIIWMKENSIGQSHLASMLLVSRQTVYAWTMGICGVSEVHEIKLALITKDTGMAQKLDAWRQTAPGMEE